jgi:hypothetical protein
MHNMPLRDIVIIAICAGLAIGIVYDAVESNIHSLPLSVASTGLDTSISIPRQSLD